MARKDDKIGITLKLPKAMIDGIDVVGGGKYTRELIITTIIVDWFAEAAKDPLADQVVAGSSGG